MYAPICLPSVSAGAEVLQSQTFHHLHRASFSGATTHPVGQRWKDTKGTDWKTVFVTLICPLFYLFIYEAIAQMDPDKLTHSLCTARRSEEGHWKGPGDGAQFRSLLWCDYCEHIPRPGILRAEEADRQVGHRASVGTHHLAELRVTVSLQQFRGSEVEASKTDSAQATGSLACSPYLSRLWEGGCQVAMISGFLHVFCCVYVSL